MHMVNVSKDAWNGPEYCSISALRLPRQPTLPNDSYRCRTAVLDWLLTGNQVDCQSAAVRGRQCAVRPKAAQTDISAREQIVACIKSGPWCRHG